MAKSIKIETGGTTQTSSAATSSNDTDYWRQIRAEFTIPPEDIYLNNGSYGPVPKPVVEAQIEYTRKVAAHPFRYGGSQAYEGLRRSKEKLGAFVGASPENIAFVPNVTMAINIVAQGLSFKSGDELVTTDQEYGAVNHCWDYVVQKQGMTIKRVALPKPPDSPEQLVDLFHRAITPQTRVISVSHITTSTGLILPVEEICRMARERGILTVIDGAHAPGMIPVHIEQIGCDFYAATCNKWMLCPLGTGFLYASPEAQERLEPWFIGWGWRHGESPKWRSGRTIVPDSRFLAESEVLGTRDLAPLIAIATAVDFLNDLGIERIAARNHQLATYFRQRLTAEFSTYAIWTPADRTMACALTTFLPDDVDGTVLFDELLEKYRIQILSYSLYGKPAPVRISTHFYNTTEELDRLIAAMGEIVAQVICNLQ